MGFVLVIWSQLVYLIYFILFFEIRSLEHDILSIRAFSRRQRLCEAHCLSIYIKSLEFHIFQNGPILNI